MNIQLTTRVEKQAKRLNNRGQALILALGALVSLSILSISFMSTSVQQQRLVSRQIAEAQNFYLAEGAMEDAVVQFKSAIANFQVNPNTTQYPSSGNILTNFSAAASFPNGATATTVITEAETNERTVADPDGLSIRVKIFRVTTSVSHPEIPAMSLTMNRIITRRLIYTFQHAVFYEDDLELLPGPDMTFSGRIHGNNDIYLGANNTLAIDSEYLRSTGDVFNRRKDDGSVPGGAVNIKKAGTSDFFAMAGFDSADPNWKLDSQALWNGTVKSSVHGVTELTIPAVGSIQSGGFYDTQASIKISNGNISVNGTSLVEGVNLPPGTITSTTTFYNNRENKWVKMTEVDLGKLAGGVYGGTTYPNHLANSNGLIYATRSDEGALQGGVRLKNGTEIKRDDGLTIVSDEPVYVQGDYNTVSKKPTAVICDAINLLSNNWNDSSSVNGLDSRVAVDTIFNTAFIAGIDTTSTGNYNGGLENYPRMHEKWSNKELKIRGSFVAIWNSQVAQGGWSYGNPQYTAPIRNWDYDTDFLTGGMPPFTPWAVEVQKGAWWIG